CRPTHRSGAPPVGRAVRDEDSASDLEARAELRLEARSGGVVLAAVGGHEPVLERGVVERPTGGRERGPVRLADRDARLSPPRLDAPHAPGGGRGGDVDGARVVEEPDLRGLPEGARLPLALHVDVLALLERAL